MMLQVREVSKRFGGLQALNNVSFELADGQILGLIGPNGAGKTTLFNVINGVFRPSAGRIIFRGADITGMPPYHIAHLGMARTHQIVRPLNELSVRENVMVGACFGRAAHGLQRAAEIADQVLRLVRLDHVAAQLAGTLNVAQKKRLELARALAAEPYLLLLDEVLAGLNPAEVAAMVETIREVRERGVTIIIIEHLMHAVMNLSDRVLVLDYGELLAAGTPQEIVQNPKVIEAYLGDPAAAERLMADEQPQREETPPQMAGGEHGHS